ncbi:tRNA (adenosine(37)-N6)-threonylcarbamoyltransferase complex ATPase subunit type 1 TsaE [Microcoleus sp. FACHB-1515]|uniref:tRNA (adenosine(37)-N6)-threonylcarbamoyltransferase complex ATPase subunit type 1 TsaE n=1 Tax=Cyanophyceae TaxID=3028117 RepID=UPI001688A77C|nr:tRNA (adenosine(37)-N6)-threonylcarbamoyltransferase complex ATPase subunit type 1 TsaE [Microcoleus sp. FACHB-1515]MBD2091893.1 tRNA (adenosine(37)-N6)-threonylcarbamoyltransferase complex ATPase subunit type 1 TsaE [Microcoleus sp. FACHB-1515]
MSALTFHLADADATADLGALLGRSLPAGSVIFLTGNLGSGKTTLVQGLGRELGITDAIASPTFTLINEYLEGRLPLYHLDLYRLDPAEVQALNLESYWEGQEQPLGIVAIEWAERLAIRPDAYLEIHLTMTANGQRQAEIAAIGKAANWLEAIATSKT